MTTYIGLAFSASMLPKGCINLRKEDLSTEQVLSEIEKGVTVCFNPSHEATIVALREKYDVSVEIPEIAPRINLASGDAIIVLQVSGLPRLSDPRRESFNSSSEYTRGEIESADFRFMRISVL